MRNKTFLLLSLSLYFSGCVSTVQNVKTMKQYSYDKLAINTYHNCRKINTSQKRLSGVINELSKMQNKEYKLIGGLDIKFSKSNLYVCSIYDIKDIVDSRTAYTLSIKRPTYKIGQRTILKLEKKKR